MNLLLFILRCFIASDSIRLIIADTQEPLEANRYAKTLYDDLMSNYNRLIRPVINLADTLEVRVGLRLSQLIGVNLKNQVMTTNLWVEQVWIDQRLTWDPEEYGGVEELHVPSENIWLPDIVLFNNADGNYEVTMMTKATVKFNGEVTWVPPAIYKSYCEMDVEWFPFDEQNCPMKIGSWTYHGLQVNLKHVDQTDGANYVANGIDLKEFYMSVEWDVLGVPATRNEEYYPCCEEPYIDVSFTLMLRRKTLFYTVNLIIPVLGISFLTVLVFYLPSDCGEKVSLTVNILVSLTVFFLLLAEIIPPTSLAVPLLGKYLLFTMSLVTLSIFVTVGVLNIHFRSPSTHKMPKWVKVVFLEFMPALLCIRRPEYRVQYDYVTNNSRKRSCGSGSRPDGCPYYDMSPRTDCSSMDHSSSPRATYCENTSNGNSRPNYSPEVLAAFESVQLVAEHIKNADKDREVVEDWKYVAMVFDRFFLYVFTIACVSGACIILLQAPSLYDSRVPLDLNQLQGMGKVKLTPQPAAESK
ncbi:acetylcholine receptor subunit beta-like 2 [Folsomia candida]|uniref:acetylcholine receptor subunit beta-like 2 n=1 Tax=Folsomia candida TaxID=158441 RepID=UPI000B8F708E|nr:acetylcholine receptor subunit beta-like 2 [Folsomia candida]